MIFSKYLQFGEKNGENRSLSFFAVGRVISCDYDCVSVCLTVCALKGKQLEL